MILFVLYTGIRWEFFPREPGYGSGMTCWRRLRDRNEAGVWQQLRELLPAEPRGAGMPDLSRAAVDSDICMPTAVTATTSTGTRCADSKSPHTSPGYVPGPC